MNTTYTRTEWLRRKWPSVLLLSLTILLWVGFVDLVLDRSLGITSGWIIGQPMSPWLELLMDTICAAPLSLFLSFLLAFGMCIATCNFRWWVMVSSLFVVGTPVGLFVGRPFLKWLWARNTAGTSWEESMPVALGFLLACLVGLVADKWISYLQRRHSDKWAALPSFGVAYAISGASLLGVILWIVLDASFQDTIEFVMGGFHTYMGADVVWQAFGCRLTVLSVLVLLAALGFTILAMRLFVGKGIGRGVLGIMLTTILIAGWLSLLMSYDRLSWAALQFRLRRGLPHFKAVASQLLERSPTTNGALPNAGEYLVSTNTHPDVLFFSSTSIDEYPFRESFGPFIWRMEDGGVRFSLAHRSQTVLEYHPGGQMPSRTTKSSSNNECWLVRTIELEKSWYLAHYSAPL